MNIAVCDDDKKVISFIKNTFNNYFASNNIEGINVSYYHSSFDIEHDIEKGITYDAYFLDVIMDGKNGIRIGSLIRSTKCGSPIIFLTSSKDYALAAFGVRANNYILKPISSEKLIEELKNVISLSSHSAKKPVLFSVPSLHSTIEIDVSKIVSIKTMSHIFYFTMSNGQNVESSTMRISSDEFLEPIIKSDCFLIVKRGTIINLNYIKSVNSEEFVLTNGDTVKPPKSKFVELRKQYFDFLANSKGEHYDF